LIRLNWLDRICVLTAMLVGSVILVGGLVGAFTGFDARVIHTPFVSPVAGAIPMILGWGIVRATFAVWRLDARLRESPSLREFDDDRAALADAVDGHRFDPRRTRRLSEIEFLLRGRGGGPVAELKAGRARYRPPGGVEQARITTRLGRTLDKALRGAPDEVLINAGFQLDDDTVLLADLAVVREPQIDRVGQFIVGPPRLAVFLVPFGQEAGEAAVDEDRFLRAGTESIWLIDVLSRRVQIRRRQDGRTSHEVVTHAGTLTDPSIAPGFSVAVASLFAGTPEGN
jgi:Uma2 family endonuclease